jgi:hypothetical protein
MSWKLVTKSAGCAFMVSWLQDKKIGTTNDVRTCITCGYVGKLDIVHYRVWMALLFIPAIPISNFDRGVCPQCHVAQETMDNQGNIIGE